MRVLLFGRLGDVAGWRERSFDPPPANLSGLKALLAGLDAALGDALNGPGVQAAVDRAIVRGDVALAAGAEVAFLPPMSGGSAVIRLTTEPFDPGAELTAFCARPRRERRSGELRRHRAQRSGQATALSSRPIRASPKPRSGKDGGGGDAALLAARRARGPPAWRHRTWRADRYGGDCIRAPPRGVPGLRLLMDYLKSRAPFWKKEHGPAARAGSSRRRETWTTSPAGD